jgi:hypothetical protein
MSAEDISRFLFQPRKRYSGVRMQQGRVWLDSDWNEDERIRNEDLRRALMDIVCAKGSPNQGFRVLESTITSSVEVELPDLSTTETYNFAYGNGSFYLGGLRYESETAEDNPERFLHQPDWLQVDATADNLPSLPTQERYDLVYLKGWEQCVTAIEDSELREQALGGPDTSVRVRRMRRVEVLTDVPDSCAEAMAALEQRLSASIDKSSCELTSKVRLTVEFHPDEIPEDPCIPAVEQGYIGADNQAIRVQLTASDRFVWGYNNAAPLYRVKVQKTDPYKIKFLNLPADQMAFPLAGQTVEISPWGAFLPNREKVAELPGQFFTIESGYNPDDNTATLATPVPTDWLDWFDSDDHLLNYGSARDNTDEGDNRRYFYLRLWTGTEQPFTTNPGDTYSLIGTGLTVSFSSFGRRGDYWVLAARPHTPAVVVPWDLMKEAPPMGPKVFLAPLALIRWSVNANGTLLSSVKDCRHRFQPLCEIGGCCTVTVGDGRTSRGLFNSLEDAINFLPPEGGKICLLPGRHQVNVTLQNRQHIHITGCGKHTLVHPRPGQVKQPIFRIDGCQQICLEQVTIAAFAGTAVQVLDSSVAEQPSQGIYVLENHIVACIHAVEVRVDNDQAGNNDIRIAYNHIAQLDKPNEEDGKATIFCIADGVLIERNRLVVFPAPDPDDPTDSRDPEDFDDNPFDPCLNPEIFLDFIFPLEAWVAETFQYIAGLNFVPPRTYQALGGIQIGGGSEHVKICRNEIIGGYGHGITLGHWPRVLVDGNQFEERDFFVNEFPAAVLPQLQERFVSTLYDIVIAENTIRSMGLSGIGVGAFLIGDRIGLRIRVENLTVYRNVITYCAQQLPTQIPEELLPDMGFGGIALTECENAIIQENQITDNGRSQHDPVCGVYVQYGEKINLDNNRILNNGPRTTFQDDDIRRGIRGGIFIGMSFQSLFNEIIEGQDFLSPDGIPAVKIHNNIVTQPLGQALFINALGPVSVVGNQFTSQGVDARVNPISLLAGTVFILNLGVSKDLIVGMMLLSSFRESASANPESFTTNLAFDPDGDQLNTIRRILYLPSGNSLFNNNQTTLDLRTDEINFALSSILIASLDDISFGSNQSECTSLLDLLLTNTAIWGITIRANDNRLQEGLTVAPFSLFSLGLINTTTDNQATHCLIVLAIPFWRVENSNTVLYPFILQNGDRISCQQEHTAVEDFL